jgi:hypothetical protein
MDRRSVFRNLAIVAGGILIMPSCSQDETKASIRLNNLDIDAETERLLAEISDTIIPETDTPGAKGLNIHLFVLKMLDDCYEKESQQKFISGLKQLEADTKKRFGNSFIRCTPAERSQLLMRIENEEGVPDDMDHFYSIMKERTIQGYMNSKYVMTNLVIYEIISSTPYNGYAPA